MTKTTLEVSSLEVETPRLGLWTSSLTLGAPSLGVGTTSLGVGTPSVGLGARSHGLGTQIRLCFLADQAGSRFFYHLIHVDEFPCFTSMRPLVVRMKEGRTLYRKHATNT